MHGTSQPSPDAEIYEAARDNTRYHIWSGDRFVAEPGTKVVTQIRTIPRWYFEQAQNAAPERIQLVSARARTLEVVR